MPRTELKPRPGGELTWRWNEFFEWKPTVENWEPDKHLMTRYDSVDDGRQGKRPLFVDFQREARGAGGIRHGWPIELRSLRHYLENHLGAKRRVAWSTAAVDLAPEEAWSRLTARCRQPRSAARRR